MVAQKLNGVGFGDVSHRYADNQPVLVHLVFRSLRQEDGFGLFKHGIGRHDILDYENNRR